MRHDKWFGIYFRFDDHMLLVCFVGYSFLKMQLWIEIFGSYKNGFFNFKNCTKALWTRKASLLQINSFQKIYRKFVMFLCKTRMFFPNFKNPTNNLFCFDWSLCRVANNPAVTCHFAQYSAIWWRTMMPGVSWVGALFRKQIFVLQNFCFNWPVSASLIRKGRRLRSLVFEWLAA